jgi:hypothetical protein
MSKYRESSSFGGKDIFMIIVIFLFLAFCSWAGMPTLRFGFWGWPVMLTLVGGIIMLFDLEEGEPSGSWRVGFGGLVMAIGVIFFTLVPMFSSSVWIRTNDFRNQIGKVEQKIFSEDFSPISPEEIIVIDYDIARKLADKKLQNDNMALGSQVVIGDFTLQKVILDGKVFMFYVAPLNHTSWWKYRVNKEGTPGFMMVNATNAEDVRLVQKLPNGQDVRLKYQAGACFGDYLKRHIYKNGYRSKGFSGDLSNFEVDDELNPYYIITLYDKTIGYAGNEATGILTVNPMNGEIKEYSLDDAPTWIDRMQPKEFCHTQFDNWGKWVHGWPNFSDKDKMVFSQGIQVIYGDNGRCYYYSGVTSVGTDESSVGFVLIDTRNKQTTFYKTGGATEFAAQRSAEGKVQEKQYRATDPRPYNINGIWTYVMALKDNEGLIKDIALVSYMNYDIVGVGENITDAIRNYKSALNNKGNVVAFSSGNTFFEVKDAVTKTGSDVRNGNEYHYFVVKTLPHKLFVTTSNLTNEVALTSVGDSVLLKFKSGEDGEIFVEYFDNLNIVFQKTEAQVGVEKKDEAITQLKDSVNVDTRFKAKVENMTTDEKKELLNKK